MDLLKLVQHPKHVLRIGHNIWSRDIEIRAYVSSDLPDPSAAQLLDFVQAEIMGIANDSPFGSAQGYVDHRTLPGHPHRESPDGIDRFKRMKSYASFAGTPGVIVLDPKTAKYLNPSVIHSNGDTKMIFPYRIAQQIPRWSIEA
jgi:hypothetical protein